MIIKIKNLKLRTYIGIYDWEQKSKQDVVVNLTLTFDGKKAGVTDAIENTVNYKAVNKSIIALVENNRFNLVEKMAVDIAQLVMKNSQVQMVSVEVDKPGALRYTDSVSVIESLTRE